MALYVVKRWLHVAYPQSVIPKLFFTLVLLCTGTISTYPRVWDFETPR